MRATGSEAEPVDFSEPIWEWQEEAGEWAADYACFLVYANLKPAERSYKRAWKEWTKGTEKATAPLSPRWSRIGEEWHWPERAAARDIAELRGKYITWADRDWEWREKDYNLGGQLRAKAERALANIAEDDELVLSVSEVANLAKIASELQAKAIPQIFNLSALQVQETLARLPEAKRLAVIELMTQKQLPAPASTLDITEAEYTVVDDA